ncbi:hypothetical protein ACFQ0B_28700 [Nonomuraea thailandensis]
MTVLLGVGVGVGAGVSSGVTGASVYAGGPSLTVSRVAGARSSSCCFCCAFAGVLPVTCSCTVCWAAAW